MRITKEFTFDAAHALYNYDGLCANIHGHRWKVEAEWEGNISQGSDMVIDFKELKAICSLIEKELDHSLILYNGDPLVRAIEAENYGRPERLRLVKTPWIPTAEKLSCMIFRSLQCVSPLYVTLVAVRLWESPTSKVETFQGV